MKATFNCAVRYWVTAVCKSPFRTGNMENDPEQVLLSLDGRPLLQGSSIAGALRAWKTKLRPDSSLFGDQDKESAIQVSDALFARSTVSVNRPRICVDGHSGTVTTQKFDVAGLPTGSECSFEILWKGFAEQKEEAKAAIEDRLCAVNAGDITFGAQRSNGYGRMWLSVKRREYDMTNSADRQAWRDDTNDGSPLELRKAVTEDLVLEVTADIASLLVKASTSIRRKGQDGQDYSVQIHFQENGEPTLPASSVKGAVKAHMAYIAKFCGVSSKELESWFGREARDSDQGLAGQLVWTDGHLIDNKKKEEVKRIRINRITGGIMGRALLTEEPVRGIWKWEIRVPSDFQKAILPILYALRDLGLGIYQLGGTQSVGRGIVREITVNISAANETACLHVKDGTVTLEDPHGFISGLEERGVQDDN